MPRINRQSIRARCLAAANLLLVALAGAPCWGDVDLRDQQFVDGLRQRRLFSLAESYCRQQLDLAQLPDRDAAAWTIELIRIHSDQAVNTMGPARDGYWRKAADVAERFEAAYPDHPRLVLVKVQAALALLARGELARMEAEVVAMPEAALAVARETIRAAARQFESIDEDVAVAIPLAARNSQEPAALTAAELTSLQQNVRYQWARALRNQALCYPAGTPDRLAALTQAVRMLDKPLQILAPTDPLAPRIKIDQAICQRLLGELNLAAAMLGGLDAPGQPAAIRLAARAESLRLLLVAGKVNEALERLGDGRTIDGVSSPELDFAILEVYVSQWRVSGSAAAGKAGEWEQKSVATLEFIEQTHGPYWARRAELLLVGVNLRAGSGNVGILDRVARDLYLKQRYDEAVVAYDNATQAAQASNDSAQAFGLAYKAALIQQQLKHHADARRRFQRLALAQPDNALASNAHLLAIVNVAQEARSDASLVADYEKLLSEHLQMWPRAETSDTARLWLGQLHESRREWDAAVASFSEVTTASENFAAAVSGSIRCWSQWLKELQANGDPDPIQAAAQSAVNYADKVLRRNGGELPEQWDEFDGACLVWRSRVQLQYLQSNDASLERLLRTALENAGDSATWRNSARSLLILAIVGKPNGRQESEQLLAEMGDAPAEQLLELLAGIEQVAADTPQLAASVATLQRDLADRLLNSATPLPDSQQLRVAMIRAAALVALGDADSALGAYAALARQHPDQASVQVAYGEQLLLSDDREQLQIALAQWRRVAAKTRPRTPRWFRAKYAVALTQFKLGDKAAAAKLIRYLQATEDLTASGLEREFQELLARCR